MTRVATPQAFVVATLVQFTHPSRAQLQRWLSRPAIFFPGAGGDGDRRQRL